jgi:hypothetical protein
MRRRFLALVLAFALHPTAAQADGAMWLEEKNIQGSVKASAQRAVLWLRDGTWEIHIQPVFPRDPGRAAWVVPFPVRPEISLSSLAFFDELEILTSPIFFNLCYRQCCGRDCDGGATGGGEITGLSAGVRVWERGTVGQLDYLVLSSRDGDSLPGWLQQNGFRVPEEAAPVLEALAEEGQFFFVARLSEAAEASKPLDPVRFVLPGVDNPAYPMRLTRLLVPEGDALDLTLWVVTPADRTFGPISHPTDSLAGEVLRDPDAYAVALGQRFFSNPAGLVLTYQEILRDNDRLDGLVCAPWGASYLPEQTCVRLENLGIDLPSAWSAEVTQIADAGLTVSRYQARPGRAAGMAQDIAFGPQEPRRANSNLWLTVDSCFSCPPEEASPQSDDSGFVHTDDELPATDAGQDPSDGQGSCSTAGGVTAAASLLALAALGWLRVGRRGRSG